MDIEFKWEEFQKETQKIVDKVKISKWFVLFTLFCIGMFLFGLLFKIVLMIFSFGLISALCIGYGLIATFYLENKIEERRKQFFDENKDQMMIPYLASTTELTTLQSDNSENIFLLITKDIAGTSRQKFDFATKTEKGIQLKQTWDSDDHFYHEVNKLEDIKPRLEIMRNKFVSKTLERVFRDYVDYSELCYIQYTFFVPEGSVKNYLYS